MFNLLLGHRNPRKFLTQRRSRNLQHNQTNPIRSWIESRNRKHIKNLETWNHGHRCDRHSKKSYTRYQSNLSEKIQLRQVRARVSHTGTFIFGQSSFSIYRLFTVQRFRFAVNNAKTNSMRAALSYIQKLIIQTTTF